MKIIQKLSPNFTVGRNGYKIEILCIHIMAGSLSGTDNWFANPISQVSAHYGIGKTGETHQYVAEENKAWANGKVNNPTFKLYKPNVNPNLYTISIECEGYDLKDSPETQLNALVALLTSLCDKYAIKPSRDTIIGHYEVDGLRKANCPTTDRTFLDKIVARLNPKLNPKTLEQKKAEIIFLINAL